MQLFLLIAISVVVVQLAMYRSNVEAVDKPVTMVEARVELDKYRGFAFAASGFVTGNAYAGPGIETITWEQIKTQSTTPPGARGVEMPASWTVRRDASRWAICAPLQQTTVNMMSQMFPSEKNISTLFYNNDNTQQLLVVGENNTSEASAYATLCLQN